MKPSYLLFVLAVFLAGSVTACTKVEKSSGGDKATTEAETSRKAEPDYSKRSVDENNKDGMAALQSEDFERAERIYLAALRQVEGMRGQEARYAMVLSNLAAAYEGRKMYAQAVPLLNRAQRLFIRAYGRFADPVYVTLGNLGRVLGKLNRWEEAATVYQTATNLMEEGKATSKPIYKDTLSKCLEAWQSARNAHKAAKIEAKLKELK